MKRKITVLSLMAALIALALPASSLAKISPAGDNFQMSGGAKLSTSLGSCTIGKMTGTVPASGESTKVGVSTPASSSCTTGASVAFAGEWTFTGNAWGLLLRSSSTESVTMKFTSLPACKLVGSPQLFSAFQTGHVGPPKLESGYLPIGRAALTWQNNSGSCALAGKAETVSWESWDTTGTGGQGLAIGDSTNPSNVIVLY